MALYAAFGRNLDPAAMSLRAPNSPPVGPGWLPGWRLTFGGADLAWHGALPTIVEDRDHQVFVMLYAMSDADERNLDSAEGFDLGFYRKLRVQVSTLDGTESAWLYVLEDYEGGFPRKAVIADLVSAAEAAGAPADYIERLRSWPTEDE